MKTIFLFLLICLVKIPAAFSQQAISEVILANKREGIITSSFKTEGTFFIGEYTKEFKAFMPLAPLFIPDADDSDSKPLLLVLKGTFPLTKIDFMTTADNGKVSKMMVTAQLNGVSREMEIPFTLYVSSDAPFAANGNAYVYQPRLNAELILDPRDFGMDLPPYNFQGMILIGMKNVVLNK